MKKEWKGKPSDIVLVVIYFILYSIVLHIGFSINQSFKKGVDFMETALDPMEYLLMFGIMIVFMSPVGVYFSKVPKSLMFDTLNKKMEVRKRSKTLKYNTDKIRFFKRETQFFFILEIHATFINRKNEEFEKLATTIIVPNWGLSWNRKKMEEIISVFRNEGVGEIKFRPDTSLIDYFYN